MAKLTAKDIRKVRDKLKELDIFLKPCPFCGGKQEDLWLHCDPWGCWKVSCRFCGGQSGRYPAHVSNAKAQVVKLWNTRPVELPGVKG
jgi:hypothetical protein